MKWTDVPLPPKMVSLPKDHRGFPVPFIVLWVEGKPVFTANDSLKVWDATINRLCGICGKKLFEDSWMLGGPESAFNPRGAYIDSPIHHDCAVYALQACPYLAFSSYRGAVDVQKMAERFPEMSFVNYTQSSDRVPFFVLGRVSKWRRSPDNFLTIERPLRYVEYWNSGSKITFEQAKERRPDWPTYYPQS